jgi:phage recombination protein Bet
MEKVIKFSKEQKALIFNRFVAPMNGTKEEGMHFIEYCEMLGLNPLLNDIVFQKYETKFGPRVSFVTTRDGLLRVAVRDENYVGPPISNVVREGDHFEFLPAEGTVIHKFGEKRGRILGAYAVLYHRKFRPYACWAEFQEYFKANARSQGGKSQVWDSYPSTMIEKVAEAFALKRQFPVVGGLTTEEELGMEGNISAPQEIAEVKHQDLPKSVQSPTIQTQQTQVQTKLEDPAMDMETETEREKPAMDMETETEREKIEIQTQESKGIIVQIVSIQKGKTGNGTPYAKINIRKEGGEEVIVLARDEEKIKIVENLQQGQKVRMEVEEMDGFHFIKGVEEID